MTPRPKVFISCGQQTPEEIKLGEDIATLVEKAGYAPYFAQKVSSVQSLTENIFEQLRSCQGFITVMHDRGIINHSKTGKVIEGRRISVWIEQEIAIAAFMQSVMDKKLEILAFEQREVKREGVRQFIQLNPIQFDSDNEILPEIESTLRNWRLPSPDESAPNRMQEWLEECHTGWLVTIDREEPNALTDKFGDGYFTIAYQILNLEDKLNLTDLRRFMNGAGPGPMEPQLWAITNREGGQPYQGEKNILECYFGGRELPGAGSEFWRARTDGFLFSRNGHREDMPEKDMREPGTAIWFKTPIFLIGYGLKHASRLAKLMNKSAHHIKFVASWTGVLNRELVDLVSYDISKTFLAKKNICKMKQIDVGLLPVSVDEIDNNLVEILVEPVCQVYSAFNYDADEAAIKRIITNIFQPSVRVG